MFNEAVRMGPPSVLISVFMSGKDTKKMCAQKGGVSNEDAMGCSHM